MVAFVTLSFVVGSRAWVQKRASNLSKRNVARLLSHSNMSVLPGDVIQYSQVPKTGHITADKIPSGLLKNHSTKAGTWGIIRVDQGVLQYTIQEPTVRVFELRGPDDRGVIEPEVLHCVKALSDDLKFVVEFYRKANTGSVDEPREGLIE